MKILLINPPDFHAINSNVPQFVNEETGLYPPLGLMYVAAYAEKNTDFEIEILDAQVEKNGYDNIGKEIKLRNPDVIGIQTMTFTLIDAILVAKLAKKINSKIHVCLGGPHVSIYPEETINLAGVDSIVLGEGEYTFTDLINSLEKGGDLSKIKGIMYKENGKVKKTEPKDFIEDLDALPFPSRDLLPYKKYYSVLAKRIPITTMMTSRGCPYKCIFCDRPHLGKAFRARGSESVVNEMQECIKIGINEIFIYDDTFSISKKRVLEICDEILNRNLKIGWDIRARVDTVDEKILTKLKEAGCERIHYGVESGTSEILKVLRKGIRLDQVERVFKMTKEIGITTLAYFMIGNPTETKEQIMETIKFARKINPDYAHFALTTPFPGTDLYQMGIEKGIFKNDYWREFAKNPEINFTPKLWEEILSREELIEFLKHAYKSFYIRPSYLLREIIEIKSWSEFKRKTKAGAKLIKYGKISKI